MTTRRTAAIWPLMGIHAQDTKHTGAWRLHVLASTLDHTEGCDHANNICKGGSGKIDRAILETEALALGVKRSTFFHWLADARAAGILNGSGKSLYLASQAELTEILLCNSIDARKAIIPLKALFKTGWKSVVWAAYNKANHNKKIISSAKLNDITGVPLRTQRRHNNLVKRTRNIAITTTDGDPAVEFGKHEHKGEFVFVDPQQKNRRVLAYAIPARRSVSDTHAKIGAFGRRRVLQKAIERVKARGLFNNGNYPNSARPQQATNRRTITRLFHETKKQIQKAGRLVQALHRAPGDPFEVFVTRGRKYAVGAFDALPVG